jgi:hypothetical protein
VFNSGTGLAIPAGKRFVVQTVSVFGYSSDPDRITAVWLTTSNIDTYVSLDPQTTEGKFLGPSGPGSTFAIAYNRNIDFVYNAGEIPKVEVIAGAQFPKTVNIFLHGYYVTL